MVFGIGEEFGALGEGDIRREDIWGDPTSLADAREYGDLLPVCPSQPLSGDSTLPL